jgi:hypothetical protein
VKPYHVCFEVGSLERRRSLCDHYLETLERCVLRVGSGIDRRRAEPWNVGLDGQAETLFRYTLEDVGRLPHLHAN